MKRRFSILDNGDNTLLLGCGYFWERDVALLQNASSLVHFYSTFIRSSTSNACPSPVEIQPQRWVMDPISAISHVASLAQLIDVTSKTLRYLNNVKNARKSRAQVAQEASLLLALLTSLRYRLEDSNAGDPWVQGARTSGMSNGPLAQFRVTDDAITQLGHLSTVIHTME